MNDEINRLGFDAWCDNKFVDAIENFSIIASGEVVTESDDVTIKLTFDDSGITCVIRAYTPEGWKTYEKTSKRPSNRG